MFPYPIGKITSSVSFASLFACIGQEFIAKGEKSFPKMQNHRFPVRCYREVYKYHADHITEKVNESFELSEYIVRSLLGSFSSLHCPPGQGYFLWALPISFLKPFLSRRSSSEAAAYPSSEQQRYYRPLSSRRSILSCLSCPGLSFTFIPQGQ